MLRYIALHHYCFSLCIAMYSARDVAQKECARKWGVLCVNWFLCSSQIGGSGVLVQPMTYIFDEEPERWQKVLDAVNTH